MYNLSWLVREVQVGGIGREAAGISVQILWCIWCVMCGSSLRLNRMRSVRALLWHLYVCVYVSTAGTRGFSILQSWLVNEAFFLSCCLGYLPREWQPCPIFSLDTHCSQHSSPTPNPDIQWYSEAVCVAMAFIWAQILKSSKNKHFLPLYSM